MKAPWLKNALIGVNSPVSLAVSGTMGSYFGQVLAQPVEPALSFSQVVGTWSACRLAAVMPENINESALTQNEALEKTPAESSAALLSATTSAIASNSLLARLLAQVIHNNHTSVMYEACSLLAAHQLTIPYNLLPDALDAGQRSVALRPALLKAIGLQGQWLAGFNKQWRYASSDITEQLNEDDERLWQEGSPAQREAFFQRCRTLNPSRARELLSEQLKEIAAKERFTFVSIMSINLSADDEAFLMPLLKDRSRDVKQTAAMLLAHIPQSAVSQQLIAWLAPLIRFEKGFVRSTWHCSAPLKADPGWSSFALETVMPKHTNIGGERAWWLYQLVRLVPLSWWTAHTDMTPNELIRWAQKTDWTSSLLRGWLDSATEHDYEWIIAMLEQPQKGEFAQHNYRHKLLELLGKLPLQQRQLLWESMPKAVEQNFRWLAQLINVCPLGETIPEEMSRIILLSLKRSYEKGRLYQNYTLRDQYRQFIPALAPQSFAKWVSLTPREQESNSEKEWLTEIEALIEMRQKLYALIPEYANTLDQNGLNTN